MAFSCVSDFTANNTVLKIPKEPFIPLQFIHLVHMCTMFPNIAMWCKDSNKKNREKINFSFFILCSSAQLSTGCAPQCTWIMRYTNKHWCWKRVIVQHHVHSLCAFCSNWVNISTIDCEHSGFFCYAARVSNIKHQYT